MNIKYVILISISTFLFACSAGKQPLKPDNNKNNLISGAIDKTPVYNEPDPGIFIMNNFPKSAFMLNATISFTKTIISTHVASGIKGISRIDNSTIYLSDNLIHTGFANCSSIITESDFTDIQTDGKYILGYNDKKMTLYDIELCGSILHGQMKLKNIRLIPPYLVFFENKAFSINKIGKYDTYLSGNMNDEIMDISGSSEFLSIINEVGQLITLDLITKEFISAEDISVNLTNWRLSRYTLFGITDDGFFTSLSTSWNGEKFIISQSSSKDISGYKQCFLANKGIALTCDNILVTTDQTIYLDKTYQKFIVTDHEYYGIYNQELYKLLIDKKRYIKKIDISGYEIQSCLNNNLLLLNDIDKKIKQIDLISDNISEVDSMENCTDSLELNNGNLVTSGGEIVYQFAKKVKTENNISLFLRQIGENFYYYYLEN